MASNIPISTGSGQASVATEQIGAHQYQIIKVVGGETGSTSVWGIAPDGSGKVSIVGTVTTTFSGSPSISGAVTVVGNPSVSGTVGASVLGHAPVFIVGGSMVGTSTANQSVSGTVGASVLGHAPVVIVGGSILTSSTANQSVSGTLDARLQSTNASVITVAQGSIAVAIVSGSVAVSTGNSSVQVLNFPTTQNVSGSVVAFQGTSPFIITGSIQGAAAGTSSVIQQGTWITSVTSALPSSMLVGASVMGHAPVVIVGGSILTSSTANQSVSGTIDIGSVRGEIPVNVHGSNGAIVNVGSPAGDGNTTNPGFFVTNYPLIFNGTNWDRLRGNSSIGTLVSTGSSSVIAVSQGSIAAVIVGGSILTSSTANQSVSGTVGASIIGWAPTNIVATIELPVAINSSRNSSVITVTQGSIATVIIGGSIATATTNSSVMLLNGANTIGSVTALQGTNPWITTFSNSSILTTLQGTVISSLVSTVPSSVQVGASVMGHAPVVIVGGSILTSSTANQSVSGTVGASVIGWVPIQASNTSVITVGQGSIATVRIGQIGTQITSISGSFSASVQGTVPVTGPFAEDAAHTTGDYGFPVWHVRNDTLASITSADGDYSPIAGGPVGETIVANAPITKWVQGTADFRSNTGGSVAVIAAQGASIFTYITGLQLANMGSASVLVTLSGATSSIIGYTIAPAGGGSNILYPNALKTNANGAFTASISGISSVLVSAQGFIAKI